MSKCKQCGKCCIEVGRTFWKNGNFEGCEELNRLANNGDHEDEGLACEMLSIDEQGKSVCGIHSIYGYKWKPQVCKEYPENGQLCFREEKRKKC